MNHWVLDSRPGGSSDVRSKSCTKIFVWISCEIARCQQYLEDCWNKLRNKDAKTMRQFKYLTQRLKARSFCLGISDLKHSIPEPMPGFGVLGLISKSNVIFERSWVPSVTRPLASWCPCPETCPWWVERICLCHYVLVKSWTRYDSIGLSTVPLISHRIHDFDVYFHHVRSQAWNRPAKVLISRRLITMIWSRNRH